MTELRTCDGCQRRVFVTEQSCPFCSVKLEPLPVPATSRFQAGMSRAQMLAVAAAVTSHVLTGCNDGDSQKDQAGQGGAIAGQGGVGGASTGGVGGQSSGGTGAISGQPSGGIGASGGSGSTGGIGAFGGVAGVYGGSPALSGFGGVYGGAPPPPPIEETDAGMDSGEPDSGL